MTKTKENLGGLDSFRHLSVEWIYDFVRSVFYASWVLSDAYLTGKFTRGHIESRVRDAIRNFAKKIILTSLMKVGWIG